jgi:hypothetical protein
MKGLEVFIFGGGVITLVLAGLLVSRTWEGSTRTRHGDPTGLQARVAVPSFFVSSNSTRRSAAPVSSAAKLFYAYDEALPSGYRCSAADGYVVKTSKQPDGATSLEILQRKGRLVRCGGDNRSSHRY